MKEKRERKLAFPHTFVILFCIIALMAVCSYVIPAGSYERIFNETANRNVVDPNSFTYVEQSPVSFFSFLHAIPNGMMEVADIMVFIFVVGGAFNIITQTGAMENGIKKLAYRLQGREKLIIPLMMFVFSLGGATFGMSEETIIFIPIGIALARALGYDAIVGMAMVTFGAAIGFSSGFLNPFTVGVAQKIAELPTFSGMALRVAVWLVMVIVVPMCILRYANKVRKNPECSYVRDLELAQKDKKITIEDVPLGTRDILVLLTLAGGLIIIVVGVMKFGWGVLDIAAVFLGMGILGGILGGTQPNQMARDFIAGAKDIAMGALIVGIARGILVVMSEGQILDTIVHALATLISGLPKAVAAEGMLIVQCIINFFIPSGSGQAAVTMPIMAPLADALGVSRQTAVLAFQFGDGFTNAIIPTHGTLCASLGVAGIPFNKWFKFALPVVAVELLICSAFVIFAAVTGYGPF